MQLLEALMISLINTLIIVSISMVRIRYQERMRIYGPTVYKLDESNNLREIPPNSIPIEKIKALQERIISKIKPKRCPINKTTIAHVYSCCMCGEFLGWIDCPMG